MYPENWLLTEGGDSPPYQVAFESPSGSMWILHAESPETNAQQLIEKTQKTFEAQYEDVEWTPATETFEGFNAIGANGLFYSLDFLVTVKIRAISTDDFTYLLVTQSESRDFDKLEPVFSAMTISLLKSELPYGVDAQ